MMKPTSDIQSCASPDPSPRTPAFDMPAGACDTHFHIVPAGHEHRYVTDRSYTPPALEISDFDNIARSLNIERAVVVQGSVYGVLSERFAQTELEIEQIDSQLDAVQINYNTEIYRERSQVTGEIAELEVRLPAIRQRLNETEIRSPIDGIVNRVFFNSVGAVVSSGEVVAEIVPTGGQLLIEAFVDPKDIATIEPGQAAKISLTAYDPSKYGFLLGTLTKVSADTVFREETKSSAYSVNVSIDTEIYESKSVPVSIVPGMIAQVDIIRGERTILEYFWQPIAKMKDTAFRE